MRQTNRPENSSAIPSGSSSLLALVLIARRCGIDTSHAELRRSYALPEGEPRVSTLIAIARDLGLEAKAIHIKFKDLTRLGKSFPAILRTRSGASLVLESAGVDSRVGPIATLRDPTVDSEAIAVVDERKLSEIWNGEIILVKRKFAVTDEEQPFGLAWLLGQVVRERRVFLDIGAAAFVSTIFALTPAFTFRVVINRILGNQSISTLEVLTGGLLVLVLFETILTHFRRRLTEVVASRIDARLSLFLVDRLLRLPLDYFERHPTGQTMTMVTRIWHIRSFITGQLFGTFLDAVPLLALIPIMFILNWRLTWFVIACAVMVAIIIVLFMPSLRRQFGRVVQAERKRGGHLVETIYGMKTIKALALEGRRRREWDERVAETISEKLEMGFLANWPHTLSTPFERSMFVGSVCIGAYIALTHPGETAGNLVAFAMLATRMGQPLVSIARLQQEFAEVRGAISQVADVVNVPPEEARQNQGMRPAVRGQFIFKDVSFRYSPDAPYALRHLNFAVPAGSTIGIMGRSGSGKSTIAKLLQRLHSNYDGLIKLDGLDIREINLSHLRSNLGVVLPENFLFSGTVRENISIARPDASLEQIVRAAQLAGAEEFIERMRRGYETMLEEGASNVSSGQRQRLAIARALLTDPAVLILDEATSALDAESEAIINANLRRIAEGRTVIMISHRLSMLVDCDAIMVMEQGELYDMGPHEDLLERCDVYKQLWHQQNQHLQRASKTAPKKAIGHVP